MSRKANCHFWQVAQAAFLLAGRFSAKANLFYSVISALQFPGNAVRFLISQGIVIQSKLLECPSGLYALGGCSTRHRQSEEKPTQEVAALRNSATRNLYPDERRRSPCRAVPIYFDRVFVATCAK